MRAVLTRKRTNSQRSCLKYGHECWVTASHLVLSGQTRLYIISWGSCFQSRQFVMVTCHVYWYITVKCKIGQNIFCQQNDLIKKKNCYLLQFILRYIPYFTFVVLPSAAYRQMTDTWKTVFIHIRMILLTSDVTVSTKTTALYMHFILNVK